MGKHRYKPVTAGSQQQCKTQWHCLKNAFFISHLWSFSHSFSHPFSHSLSHSFSPRFSLSLDLNLTFTVTFTLCLSLSVCLTLSPFLCLSLSLSLSHSRSRSHAHSHSHSHSHTHSHTHTHSHSHSPSPALFFKGVGRQVLENCPVYGGLFHRPPTDLKNHLLWGMACNLAAAMSGARPQGYSWAQNAQTKVTFRQLQPPTQQLQLPPEGDTARKQLHLEPAPFAQEPAHKNFPRSKAPQPRLWMELNPCRLSLQPNCTIDGANSDLRIAIL